MTDFPSTSIITLKEISEWLKLLANLKQLLKVDSKTYLSKTVLISENCNQKLQ